MTINKCNICKIDLNEHEVLTKLVTCSKCMDTKKYIQNENIVRLLNEMADNNKKEQSVFDLILLELKEIKELLKPKNIALDAKITLKD